MRLLGLLVLVSLTLASASSPFQKLADVAASPVEAAAQGLSDSAAHAVASQLNGKNVTAVPDLTKKLTNKPSVQNVKSPKQLVEEYAAKLAAGVKTKPSRRAPRPSKIRV